MATYTSELGQFLRNTFSGAQENSRIATDALVVPLGKRTTLSRARDQINNSFDGFEKKLKKIIDNVDDQSDYIKDFIKDYKLKNEAISTPVVKNKIKRNGSQSLLGTTIGALVGLASVFVNDALKELSSIATNIVANIKKWFVDKYTNMKDWLKSQLGYIENTAKEFGKNVKDFVSKSFDTMTESLKNGFGYIEGAVHTWATGAEKVIGDVFNFAGSSLHDPSIPMRAIAQASSSVGKFWNSIVASIKSWLYSIFGNLNSLFSGGSGVGSPGSGTGSSSAGAIPTIDAKGNIVYPADSSQAGIDSQGHIINSRKNPDGLVTTGNHLRGNRRESFSSGDAKVDTILKTIRGKESGESYTIFNPDGNASGAYQFRRSTWASLTKRFGVGTEYRNAADAPKDIQDKVAGEYVKDILKRSGGDVSKVPLEWYTGNIQGKISASALAANGGLTPENYQSSWMKKYNKNVSSTEAAAVAINKNAAAAPTSSFSNTIDKNSAAAPTSSFSNTTINGSITENPATAPNQGVGHIGSSEDMMKIIPMTPLAPSDDSDSVSPNKKASPVSVNGSFLAPKVDTASNNSPVSSLGQLSLGGKKADG